MNKFRASYSILNTWASGDTDKAVQFYFGLETVKTPQMAAGTFYHQLWANTITKTKKTPTIFGNKELKNPEVEKYIKL